MSSSVYYPLSNQASSFKVISSVLKAYIDGVTALNDNITVTLVMDKAVEYHFALLCFVPNHVKPRCLIVCLMLNVCRSKGGRKIFVDIDSMAYCQTYLYSVYVTVSHGEWKLNVGVRENWTRA